MVADPGGTGRSGEILPLGQAQPVAVRLGRDGSPEAVRQPGWKLVAQVLETWRVEEGWWRQSAIRRTYYELLLENGDPLTVFHDDNEDAWYVQRYE